MKALILSGGKGSRFEPVRFCKAKQLFPLANKPLLGYVLDQVSDSGIKDTIVITAPLTENTVKQYIGDGSKWGLNITFVTQEPHGLGDAVKIAGPYIGDEPFIMQLGDNYSSLRLKSLVEKFESNGFDALIALQKVFDVSRFGIAQIDKNGKVLHVVEKPITTEFGDLGIVGTYIFSKNIHSAIARTKPSPPPRCELDITPAIQELINMNYSVAGFIFNSYWIHLDTKEDVLRANRIILDKHCADNRQGSIIKSNIRNNVTIAKTAIVDNSTIVGPSIIGENCLIQNSTLGPYTCIGNGTNIVNSQIKNSVLLDNITIENQELVTDEVRCE